MMTYAMMMKSLLLVSIVVTGKGSAVEKVPTPCCTMVSRTKITEEILDFEIQKKDGLCVNAVILQTASGRYCIQHNAPWVRSRILALLRARKLAKSAATGSLLKTIAASSSPPPAFSTTGSLLKTITARSSPPPTFSTTGSLLKTITARSSLPPTFSTTPSSFEDDQ